jgi:predicted nucleic acid-binding protein
MAVVVSDTSPIRALAQLRLLDALGKLFDEVHVPPAVVAELLHPPSRFESVDVQLLPNTTVRYPRNHERVRELQAELDAGEAEALTLAEEIHADAVLIDETSGRNVAIRMGLRVLGTLGILLRAKECGICEELRPLLDALQSEHHFFISSGLRDEVLRQAGEPPSETGATP